ncbi:MAG: DUF370 domain-containing protein [Defluviitaleaceae bacterium]|nr:DUF370 domain-containing protein [Defluviitaleaceae bacterium]
MLNRPVNVGFGNVVFLNRIIAIVNKDSSPVKRMIQDAKEENRLIDATQGRRTRSVIVTDSGHIVLSSVQPETLASRINDTALYPVPSRHHGTAI